MRQVLHTQRLQHDLDGSGVFVLPSGPLGHGQVLLHGQSRTQVQFLRQKPNGLGAPGVSRHRFEIAQRLPGDSQSASAGCHQTRHQGQPSRFTAARRATEQQHGTLPHLHIGEHQPRTARVLVCQAVGFNHAGAPEARGAGVRLAQSTQTPRTAKSRCMSW